MCRPDLRGIKSSVPVISAILVAFVQTLVNSSSQFSLMVFNSALTMLNFWKAVKMSCVRPCKSWLNDLRYPEKCRFVHNAIIQDVDVICVSKPFASVTDLASQFPLRRVDIVVKQCTTAS